MKEFSIGDPNYSIINNESSAVYSHYGKAINAPTFISALGYAVQYTPSLVMEAVYLFSGVEGGTHYKIVNYDGSSGSYFPSNWHTAAEAGIPGNIGVGRLTIREPEISLTPVSQAVYIQAKCGTSQSQCSTIWWGAPVTNSPTLISPGGSTNNNPTFLFTAVSGATDYQISLYISGAFNATPWRTAAEAGIPSGIGTGSLTFSSPYTPLPSGGPWAWNIRSRFNGRTGTSAGVVWFSVS